MAASMVNSKLLKLFRSRRILGKLEALRRQNRKRSGLIAMPLARFYYNNDVGEKLKDSLPVRLAEAPRERSTIFAMSSGHGKCGVAVFRVSGPRVRDVLKSVAKFYDRTEPVPRKAYLRKLYHPVTGDQIDQGLVLWFPAPHSYTGEDCCELHVHGGKAVVASVVNALGSVVGLRYAEVGEFTRRSFENEKLDLTQVEGLGDLLEAETEAQQRQALRQLTGAQRQLYSRWKNTLLQCVAHVEAYIDFSEEELIEDGILSNVCESVVELTREISHHVAEGRCSERVRTGVRVAIVGAPNVGKSSLLNLLCTRPAAIVSPVAGTTRDVIEVALSVAGFPVIVSDTAGLRDTGDRVEKEGVRRAIDRAVEADLRLVVIDASDSSLVSRLLRQRLNVDDLLDEYLDSLGLMSSMTTYSVKSETDTSSDIDTSSSVRPETVLVLNKIDLLSDDIRSQLTELISSRCATISDMSTTSHCLLSCVTGETGTRQLLNLLQNKVRKLCNSTSTESIGVTNERHRRHLVKCLSHLRAFTSAHCSCDVVLAAQDLRAAMHQIAKIMGHVTSEHVLDIIFKDFCIGK